MSKKIFLLFIIFLSSCNEKVDLIVHNAEIYTADDNNNKATSLAVKDGKFIYVGDESAMSKYSSTNVINAEGLPIYPGFIDSHAHFYNLGFLNDQVNLSGTTSLEDVVSRVNKSSNINEKKIYALGLDVYKNEPKLNTGYLNMKNVFILPHLGSATKETRTAMANLAIDNLDEFFKTGKCKNKVN